MVVICLYFIVLKWIHVPITHNIFCSFSKKFRIINYFTSNHNYELQSISDVEKIVNEWVSDRQATHNLSCEMVYGPKTPLFLPWMGPIRVPF